jgi:hypothetical protein
MASGINLGIFTKFDPKGVNDAERALGSFTKFAAASAAVVAAVGVAWVAASAKQLMEIEKLNAQTNAAIKSTGSAAGRTIEEINGLNASLEKLTGIEAEVIQEGQNMLLTFTNINGQQFDQATEAALNLSVALGKDMQSSAMLVGKALNDPIGGISALSRAGIQFTDDQKNMIAAMVEMGDTAGAQSIILGELNTQFGGSAEAFGDTTAGKLAKVGNLFGEMGENIAVAVLPALERFADKAMELMETHGPAIEEALGGVTEIVLGMVDGFIGFTDWASENESLFNAIVVVLGSMAVALGIVTVAMWAFNIAAMANPIVLIIAAIVVAIGLLIAGIVLIWQNWDTITKNISKAWDWLTWQLGTLWAGFANMFIDLLNGMITGINGFLSAINAIAGTNFKINLIGKVQTPNQPMSTRTGSFSTGGVAAARGVRMADGGIVMPRAGGTPAIIGEAGMAEAVIPLDRFDDVVGRRGGGNNIVINVNAGMGTDGAAVGEQIVNAIRRYERTSGAVFARA